MKHGSRESSLTPLGMASLFIVCMASTMDFNRMYCAAQHSNSLIWFKISRKTWERYNILSKLVFGFFFFPFYPIYVICSCSWAATIRWFGRESDIHWRTPKSLLWNSGGKKVIKFSNQTSQVRWRDVGRAKECIILSWPCQHFLHSWQKVYTLTKYLLCSVL